MMRRSSARGRTRRRRICRRGIALVTVLYFLVIGSLASAGVFMVIRTMLRGASGVANGANLSATADEAVYASLATWDSPTRLRQQVGSTITLTATASRADVRITRLSSQLFAIVADARDSSDRVARRVALLVRLPVVGPLLRAALVSAADVSLGPNVRFVADSACGDSAAAGIALAPDATLSVDTSVTGRQPTVLRDSAAADSSTYLQIGGNSWSELAAAAEVRLASGSHVMPSPVVSGGLCTASDGNWGDPTSSSGACGARVPVIYAAGDLSIDGGVGQGVLLVAGHLTIGGPFVFSGQIVVRGGIETLADNITISGAMYAWRARDDSVMAHGSTTSVELTHQTTLRFSRCDAWHGMASTLQPRRVREHAWSELF